MSIQNVQLYKTLSLLLILSKRTRLTNNEVRNERRCINLYVQHQNVKDCPRVKCRTGIYRIVPHPHLGTCIKTWLFDYYNCNLI